MSSASEARIVTLAGGLVVPVEAIELLLDLERRGFSVAREGDALLVQPASRLVASDRTAILSWKRDLLALVDYVPKEVA